VAYGTTRGGTKRPQYRWQFIDPFSGIRLYPVKNSGLQTLKDHFIWALHLTITLQVWYWGIIDLNAWICTKVLELPHSELSSIISDNIIEHAKHDFFDEFHRLSHCDWSGMLYFDPLCETKICVNPPLGFLNGPTRSIPHVEKDQVIGMVCNRWDDTCFWWAKNRQPSHRWTRESMSDTNVGPPAYMMYPWVILHPRDCDKSLGECLARWHIICLGWWISL
jgi:hypothetical protein